MNRLLKLKPVITEKSMRLAGESQYTLFVSRGAEKLAIARAIEAAYKVHVLSVNIAKRYPKPKSRGKITGFTNQLTKAIIKLKKGEKIPGFEVVEKVVEQEAIKTDKTKSVDKIQEKK